MALGGPILPPSLQPRRNQARQHKETSTASYRRDRSFGMGMTRLTTHADIPRCYDLAILLAEAAERRS